MCPALEEMHCGCFAVGHKVSEKFPDNYFLTFWT